MADPKKEAEGDAAPKKKGKLLLFIIIGVVFLVLAGGGAAFFLLKKKAVDPDAEDEEGDVPVKTQKAAKNKEALPPPAFHKFDKPFTVKLQTEQQEAYLQVEVQLRVLDIKVLELLKQYDPELKHRITLILLAKKASELGTAPGVQKLSNEIRETVNNILEPPRRKAEVAAEPADTASPDAPVQAVLFTSFIVQ